MKRKITLTIALVLSIVLASLTSSDSTVKAQNQIRRVGDTGVVTLLGPNQVLRLTVALGDYDGNYSLDFRRTEYSQGTCSSNGVCRLAVASQTASNPIRLMSGEAASFDIPNTAFGVRGVVLSNSRNVKVTAIVFDTSTQRVVTFTNTTFDDQASQ